MEQQEKKPKQKPVKIKLEKIADLREKMQSLPKIEPAHPEILSKQEAVKMLHPEIEKLLSKNYNFEKIAEFFKTNEFPIDAPTLKTYINRLKPKTAKKNKAMKQSQDKKTTVSDVPTMTGTVTTSENVSAAPTMTATVTTTV